MKKIIYLFLWAGPLIASGVVSAQSNPEDQCFSLLRAQAAANSEFSHLDLSRLSKIGGAAGSETVSSLFSLATYDDFLAVWDVAVPNAAPDLVHYPAAMGNVSESAKVSPVVYKSNRNLGGAIIYSDGARTNLETQVDRDGVLYRQYIDGYYVDTRVVSFGRESDLNYPYPAPDDAAGPHQQWPYGDLWADRREYFLVTQHLSADKGGDFLGCSLMKTAPEGNNVLKNWDGSQAAQSLNWANYGGVNLDQSTFSSGALAGGNFRQGDFEYTICRRGALCEPLAKLHLLTVVHNNGSNFLNPADSLAVFETAFQAAKSANETFVELRRRFYTALLDLSPLPGIASGSYPVPASDVLDSSSNCRLTIYDDNFSGQSQLLASGAYDLADYPDFNQQISSFSLQGPEGCAVFMSESSETDAQCVQFDVLGNWSQQALEAEFFNNRAGYLQVGDSTVLSSCVVPARPRGQAFDASKTCSVGSSPTAVVAGGRALVSWQGPASASRYELNGEVVTRSGSQSFFPEATESFELRALASDGSLLEACDASVAVNQPSCRLQAEGDNLLLLVSGDPDGQGAFFLEACPLSDPTNCREYNSLLFAYRQEIASMTNLSSFSAGDTLWRATVFPEVDSLALTGLSDQEADILANKLRAAPADVETINCSSAFSLSFNTWPSQIDWSGLTWLPTANAQASEGANGSRLMVFPGVSVDTLDQIDEIEDPALKNWLYSAVWPNYGETFLDLDRPDEALTDFERQYKASPLTWEEKVENVRYILDNAEDLPNLTPDQLEYKDIAFGDSVIPVPDRRVVEINEQQWLTNGMDDLIAEKDAALANGEPGAEQRYRNKLAALDQLESLYKESKIDFLTLETQRVAGRIDDSVFVAQAREIVSDFEQASEIGASNSALSAEDIRKLTENLYQTKPDTVVEPVIEERPEGNLKYWYLMVLLLFGAGAGFYFLKLRKS